MQIIGITGRSGCGKSTLTDSIRAAGFRCVDADQVAREVLLPGSPCIAQLQQEFGADIVDEAGQVRRRLLDSGYPAACVDRVIEKLYEAELLDDEAYAQRWAQSRAHKHGRGRIERELTRRGVSREVAQSAVSELSDEEQLADAVRLTGKFLARTQGDFDRSLYNRTLAMLARHGYDADIARRALQIIAEGKDETPDDGDDVE